MRLINLWSDYRRRVAERDAIRHLSGLSDSLLRDIGLDRGTIREAIQSARHRA